MEISLQQVTYRCFWVSGLARAAAAAVWQSVVNFRVWFECRKVGGWWVSCCCHLLARCVCVCVWRKQSLGGGPHHLPPALVYGPSWRNKIPLIIECGKYFRCARELVGKLWIFTGCAGLQTSVFARWSVTHTHTHTWKSNQLDDLDSRGVERHSFWNRFSPLWP